MDLAQLLFGSSPERSLFMVKYMELTEREIKNRYANMRNRCYSRAYQEKRQWYRGCTVCDEWMDPEHGLDRFGAWCNANYYIIEGEGTMEIDKDILVKGNKVYSPETCLFVPKRINCMFSGSSRKNENGLPMEVQYNAHLQQYYPVLTGIDGKDIISREYFDNPEDAWQLYAQYKTDYVKTIAETYRSCVPDKVYEAIKNHVFSIDD